MSVLGEHPWLEQRCQASALYPRIWRPALWCSSPACPPTDPYYTPLSMTHLADYMAAQHHLWYPWYFKGECLYKRNSPVDSRESPSKELPTKLLKQERSKDRQELSQTLNFDKDHASKIHSKKSAGTQTQFSSFNGETHSYYSSRETVTIESYSTVSGRPQSFVPSSTQVTVQTQAGGEDPHPDIQYAPLNLSLSSGPSRGLPQHQARPSVITCATTAPPNGSPGRFGSNPGSNSPTELQPGSLRKEDPPAVTDPAIEEHFRRSLGKNYSDYIMTKTTTTPTTTPSTTATGLMYTSLKANVSITGSVDDHFAKSLGNSMWTAIKQKTDPELFTGSVDDHFAKALGGDTWLRIKAETEASSPSGSPPNTSIITT